MLGKGKAGSAYANLHLVDLHAAPLRALVTRTGIDPVVIDDVISGAIGQVGEQSGNTARRGLLAAGYPESVPGVTVDRQCGSSQQALDFTIVVDVAPWIGRRVRDLAPRAAHQALVRALGALRPAVALSQRSRRSRRSTSLLRLHTPTTRKGAGQQAEHQKLRPAAPQFPHAFPATKPLTPIRASFSQVTGLRRTSTLHV